MLVPDKTVILRTLHTMREKILMRKILLAHIVILVLVTGIKAQSYKPVDSLSTIKIIIKNVGMETEGTMTGLDGAIVFNPADVKTAMFSVSINTATINTGIEPRNVAIKSAEYLDTEKYPKIIFDSRSVSKVADTKYLVKGIISIKGIAKEISFPFTAVPDGNGMLFTGEMKLNRRDYKIAVNSTVLSESFSVMLSVVTKKIG